MTPRQFQTFSVQRKNKIKVDRRISQKSNASSAVRRAKNGSIHSFLHIPGRKTIHIARLIITHLARSPIFPLPPSISKSKIFLSLPYTSEIRLKESRVKELKSRKICWRRIQVRSGVGNRELGVESRSRESRVEKAKSRLKESSLRLFAHL